MNRYACACRRDRSEIRVGCADSTPRHSTQRGCLQAAREGADAAVGVGTVEGADNGEWLAEQVVVNHVPKLVGERMALPANGAVAYVNVQRAARKVGHIASTLPVVPQFLAHDVPLYKGKYRIFADPRMTEVA